MVDSVPMRRVSSGGSTQILTFGEEMRRFEEGEIRGRSSGLDARQHPAQPVTSWDGQPPDSPLPAPLPGKKDPPSPVKSTGKFERLPTTQLFEKYSNAKGRQWKRGLKNITIARRKSSSSHQPAPWEQDAQEASANSDADEDEESFEREKITQYMQDYMTNRGGYGQEAKRERKKRLYPQLKIPWKDEDTRVLSFNSARASTTNAYQTLLSYRRSGVSHSRDGASVLPQSTIQFSPGSNQASPEARSRSRAVSRRSDIPVSQVRAHTSMASFQDVKRRPPSRLRGQRMSQTMELPKLSPLGQGIVENTGAQFPGEMETLVMLRHPASLRHPDSYMSWLSNALSVLEAVERGERVSASSLHEMQMLDYNVMYAVKGILLQVRQQWKLYQGVAHEFGNLYGQRKHELSSLRRHLLGETGDGAIAEYDVVAPGKHVVKIYELMIRRFTARFNAQVRNSINRFWKMLPKNPYGRMSQGEYTRLHVKFFRALLPVCDVNYAKRTAEMDWEVDCGSDDNVQGLKHAQFLNSMFELADNWCEQQEPEQLVVWLNKLWVAVVDDAGLLRADAEIFHDERYWFDGIDPLGEANRWDYSRIEAQGPRNTFFHGMMLQQGRPVLKVLEQAEEEWEEELKPRVQDERAGREEEYMQDMEHVIRRDGRLLTPETMASQLKELARAYLPKYQKPYSPERLDSRGGGAAAGSPERWREEQLRQATPPRIKVGDVLSGADKMTEGVRPAYQNVDSLQPQSRTLAQLSELQTLVHARVPTPGDLIGLRLKLENINIEEFGKVKRTQDVFAQDQDVWPSLSRPSHVDVARYQEAKRRLQLEKEMRSRNSRFISSPSSSKDKKALKSFAERFQEKEQERRMRGLEEFKRRKAQRIKTSKAVLAGNPLPTNSTAQAPPSKALASPGLSSWTASGQGQHPEQAVSPIPTGAKPATPLSLEEEYERLQKAAGQLRNASPEPPSPSSAGHSGLDDSSLDETRTARTSLDRSRAESEHVPVAVADPRQPLARVEMFAQKRRASMEPQSAQDLAPPAWLPPTRLSKSADGVRPGTHNSNLNGPRGPGSPLASTGIGAQQESKAGSPYTSRMTRTRPGDIETQDTGSREARDSRWDAKLTVTAGAGSSAQPELRLAGGRHVHLRHASDHHDDPRSGSPDSLAGPGSGSGAAGHSVLPHSPLSPSATLTRSAHANAPGAQAPSPVGRRPGAPSQLPVRGREPFNIFRSLGDSERSGNHHLHHHHLAGRRSSSGSQQGPLLPRSGQGDSDGSPGRSLASWDRFVGSPPRKLPDPL